MVGEGVPQKGVGGAIGGTGPETMSFRAQYRECLDGLSVEEAKAKFLASAPEIEEEDFLYWWIEYLQYRDGLVA